MRYVCKNCGKFVAKDSPCCKSCGTENPAVAQEDRAVNAGNGTQYGKKSAKKAKCPYCDTIFNVTDTASEHLFCPSCGSEMGNPYYEDCKPTYSKGRMFLGLIVILIIIFNLWRACSAWDDSYGENNEPTAHESVVEESVVEEVTDEEVPGGNSTPEVDSYAYSYPSDGGLGTSVSKELRSAKNKLVYRSAGAAELTYYWVISATSGGNTYKYIIADDNDYKVLRSGKCVILTFAELKSQSPGAVLRGGMVSASSKIVLAGPIDEHFDAYGERRDVYAILVPNKERAQVFINDTDNPDEFLLLEDLVLQR